MAWLLPEITQRIASQTRILSSFRKFHLADKAGPRKSHLLSCSSPLVKVLSLPEWPKKILTAMPAGNGSRAPPCTPCGFRS